MAEETKEVGMYFIWNIYSLYSHISFPNPHYDPAIELAHDPTLGAFVAIHNTERRNKEPTLMILWYRLHA